VAFDFEVLIPPDSLMRTLFLPLLLSLSSACGRTEADAKKEPPPESESESISNCSPDSTPIDGTPTELLYPFEPRERGCKQEESINESCEQCSYLGRCETFQEMLARYGWPDEDRTATEGGWSVAYRCLGPDTTPYDVLYAGNHSGASSIYVFDAETGTNIGCGHTQGMDPFERYKFCCGSEDRDFIYYGDFPPLDCDGGEYAPDAFDDTGA
jgi:hypothetical protein